MSYFPAFVGTKSASALGPRSSCEVEMLKLDPCDVPTAAAQGIPVQRLDHTLKWNVQKLREMGSQDAQHLHSQLVRMVGGELGGLAEDIKAHTVKDGDGNGEVEDDDDSGGDDVDVRRVSAPFTSDPSRHLITWRDAVVDASRRLRLVTVE